MNTTMTRKEIFKKAHQIARATKDSAGDYRIALMVALKDVYAGKYDEIKDTTEAALIALGLKTWEKGGHKRIYVNDWQLERVFGFSISYYKSGNISSACLRSGSISNSCARRLLGEGTPYYNCITQEWNANYLLVECAPE